MTSMLRQLRMLTRYARWSNELLYKCLAALPSSELMKEQRIVFGSMIRTLNHVYAMDQVWRAHLEGRPHGYTTRNPPEHPPFEDLRLQQRSLDDWYVSCARELTAQTVDES